MTFLNLLKRIHCFYFTIFIACLAAFVTFAEDVRREACTFLFSCGSLQGIGYPFWGGDRPSFCGILDLKLSCHYSRGTTTLHSNQFLGIAPVLDINLSSHTVILSPERFIDICHLETKQSNILSALKHASNHSSIIELFYVCNNYKLRNHFKSLNCSYSDGTNGSAYYFDGPSSYVSEISKSRSCVSDVSFPVDDRALVELSSTNASLRSILMKYGTLKMEYMFTSCSKCEETGGEMRIFRIFVSVRLLLPRWITSFSLLSINLHCFHQVVRSRGKRGPIKGQTWSDLAQTLRDCWGHVVLQSERCDCRFVLWFVGKRCWTEAVSLGDFLFTFDLIW